MGARSPRSAPAENGSRRGAQRWDAHAWGWAGLRRAPFLLGLGKMDSALLGTFARAPSSFREPVRAVCSLAFTGAVLLQVLVAVAFILLLLKTKQPPPPKKNLRVGTRLPPLTKQNCNFRKRRAKEELINKCQSTLSFTYQLLASTSSRFYLHTMEMIYFFLKRSGLEDI